MKPIILDYIAKKILQDIRDGQVIDSLLADELNSLEFIDSLRNLTVPEDRPMLEELANSEIPNTSALATAILLNPSDPNNFLVEWDSPTTTYERKMTMMWRLLDNEHLDETIHQAIYGFVCENLDNFKKDCKAWFGNEGDPIVAINARLKDSRFPRTKDWAYLCAALSSPSTQDVKDLISRYKTAENKFVASVASDLQEKLP